MPRAASHASVSPTVSFPSTAGLVWGVGKLTGLHRQLLDLLSAARSFVSQEAVW